jgi:hypothetical protein
MEAIPKVQDQDIVREPGKRKVVLKKTWRVESQHSGVLDVQGDLHISSYRRHRMECVLMYFNLQLPLYASQAVSSPFTNL